MPLYELEVHEDDGEITSCVHEYDDEVLYQLGDLFEYEGRVLRVFQIEGSVPPYSQRLVCDISAETQEAARQVGPIAIAPNAAAQIRGKGGSLYLWQEPFGRGFLVDKADFEWPRGIHFSAFKVAGVEIKIASDIDSPERLTITRSVLPPLQLHIEWDGKVWGARGDVIGPGQTPWSW